MAFSHSCNSARGLTPILFERVDCVLLLNRIQGFAEMTPYESLRTSLDPGAFGVVRRLFDNRFFADRCDLRCASLKTGEEEPVDRSNAVCLNNIINLSSRDSSLRFMEG